MSQIPEPGEIFDGKYEIQSILGRGGNGTVYKALQVDCNRVVALKVLHREAALDEEYRSRFVREAQALSKLSHANIVTVYNLVITKFGTTYFVMEYVNARSLRAVLSEDGKLSAARALGMMRDAAMAMSYVHKSEIVHRDLKPENILIAQTPSPDTVKILDFGLIRLVNQTEQSLTSTGEVLGTVNYMSPEQCIGKKVDFRTDIYSLTCCLYELIVGEGVFVADNAVGMMYKHINEPVPKIKESQCIGFHPSLNQIIEKGLAKNPLERFASMEEMANEIQECIEALTSSNPSGQRTSLGKPLVLCICFCLAAVGSMALWKILQTHQSTAGGAGVEAIKVKKTILDPKEAAILMDLEKLEGKYGKNSPHLLLKLAGLSNYYESINRRFEAEECAVRVHEINLHNPAHGGADLANAKVRLAKIIMYRGAYALAIELLNDALKIQDKLIKREKTQTGSANYDDYNNAVIILRQCYLLAGKKDEALKILLEALALEKGAGTLTISNLTRHFDDFHDWAGAELVSQMELKDAEKAKDPYAIAAALSKLANACMLQDKLIEAVYYGRKAVAMDKALEVNDVRVRDALNANLDRLAVCLTATGHSKEAEGLFDELWKRTKDSATPHDIEMHYFRVGDCYLKQKRFKEACPLLEKALELRLKRGAIREDLDASRSVLIDCYRGLGRHDEADKELAEKERIRR